MNRSRVEKTYSSRTFASESCISLLLYSIYVNDLLVRTNASTILFADNALFTTHDKNLKLVIIRLQKQSDDTENWFNQ